MRPNRPLILEDYDNSAAFVTNHAGCAVCVWLCVLQAATDDPHIGYHHRGNTDYNQVFHFVISLFDW
jgi:hypothetical protein